MEIKKEGLFPRSLLVTFLILASLIMFVYILKVGKDLLIPLILAFLIWYLIAALRDAFARVEIKGRSLPKPFCFALAVLSILAVASLFIGLITDNIAGMNDVADSYRENLTRRFASLMEATGMEEKFKEFPAPSELFQDVDLPSILGKLAGGITSMVSNGGIIAIYLLFFFIEERFFRDKLTALFPDDKRKSQVFKMIKQVDSDIKTYVGIKTLASAITGIASYLVMKFMGLDFAILWAILIFLLNFIPTIGSIIGTIFPSLLALIQFEHSFAPFFVVAIGVTTLQMIIGNFLEPKLMGDSLNLSSLVILLSLALWGSIWGIPGMFLCVPITVIIAIVCSNFPATRPVAILLSTDGRIKEEN